MVDKFSPASSPACAHSASSASSCRKRRLDPEVNRALVEDVLPCISREVEGVMAGLIDAGVMRRFDPEIANWTLMGAVVGLALFANLGAAPGVWEVVVCRKKWPVASQRRFYQRTARDRLEAFPDPLFSAAPGPSPTKNCAISVATG